MLKEILNESPRIIFPSLCSIVTEAEAIVLGQCDFFMRISKHVIDGAVWFWKTIKQWHEVLPWMSESKIRRALDSLCASGLITKERKSKETWYQANWYTINEDKLRELLAAKNVNQSHNSNVDTTTEDSSKTEQIELPDLSKSSCSNPATHSIDTSSEKNSSYSQESESVAKKNVEEEQEATEEKPLDEHVSQTQKKCSEGRSTTSKNRTNRQDAPGFIGEKEVWEIAHGEPYPVFLNWWYDQVYKPQGGRWEVAGRSYAYAEFYKDRKRTNVIYQDFLAYANQVAENTSQQQFAGMTAILPSCFLLKPEATEANSLQVMKNVNQVVIQGAVVALPTSYATPACLQSMSFAEAEKKKIIVQLPSLEVPSLPESVALGEEESTKLLEELERKQSFWKHVPAGRSRVESWAKSTPGVVMTDSGPQLEIKENGYRC